MMLSGRRLAVVIRDLLRGHDEIAHARIHPSTVYRDRVTVSAVDRAGQGWRVHVLVDPHDVDAAQPWMTRLDADEYLRELLDVPARRPGAWETPHVVALADQLHELLVLMGGEQL